ncbi:hypothetical protein Hjap01_03294 [Haloarcula japonica]
MDQCSSRELEDTKALNVIERLFNYSTMPTGKRRILRPYMTTEELQIEWSRY